MGASEVGVAGLVVEGEGRVPAGFCFLREARNKVIS